MSRDLTRLVRSIGFDAGGNAAADADAASGRCAPLTPSLCATLKSVLTAGFYPRVAKVTQHVSVWVKFGFVQRVPVAEFDLC